MKHRRTIHGRGWALVIDRRISGKDKDRECPGDPGSVREGDVRTTVSSVCVSLKW